LKRHCGNHDLPLHEPWYQVLDNKRRFHPYSHEVHNSPISYHKCMDFKFYHPQNPAEVRDILTNDRAKAAGIVYLEDKSYKFKVKEGGREWSVYGSPVRLSLHCASFHISQLN